MKTFNDFINPSGFPTEEGKRFLDSHFQKEIANCLDAASNETELLILLGVLKNIVGNMVSDRIAEIKTKKSI